MDIKDQIERILIVLPYALTFFGMLWLIGGVLTYKPMYMGITDTRGELANMASSLWMPAIMIMAGFYLYEIMKPIEEKHERQQ
jgi:hypothetical protein